MSVDVVTFGCRLNAYESEVIRQQAAAGGVADAVVVNTCAVTGEAVRQARQTIRRLRRERPRSHASSSPAARRRPSRRRFAAMPEVDRVLGNEEKLAAASWAALDAPGKIAVGDIMAVTDAAAASHRRHRGPHPRASCRCRTAAITAARSASSRSAAAIRARCRPATWSRRRGGWSSSGYREIVLTGVDITSYAPGRSARAGEAGAARRAGAGAAAAVLDRFGRGRRRSARRARRASRG